MTDERLQLTPARLQKALSQIVEAIIFGWEKPRFSDMTEFLIWHRVARMVGTFFRGVGLGGGILCAARALQDKSGLWPLLLAVASMAIANLISASERMLKPAQVEDIFLAMSDMGDARWKEQSLRLRQISKQRGYLIAADIMAFEEALGKYWEPIVFHRLKSLMDVE